MHPTSPFSRTPGQTGPSSGQGDAAYREAKALPRTPGFGVFATGALALRLGKGEEARRTFDDEIKAGTVSPFHNGWYLARARYGAGAGTPDDETALLERAGASRLRLCEAHFDIAMRHLARGDKPQARSHLEHSLRTRVFYYFEHQWSQIFLARMKADPDWPRWIEAKK